MAGIERMSMALILAASFRWKKSLALGMGGSAARSIEDGTVRSRSVHAAAECAGHAPRRAQLGTKDQTRSMEPASHRCGQAGSMPQALRSQDVRSMIADLSDSPALVTPKRLRREGVVPLVRSERTRCSRKLRAPRQTIPWLSGGIDYQAGSQKAHQLLQTPSRPPPKPPANFSSEAAPNCARETRAALLPARAAPRPGPAGRSRSARPTRARCSRRRRSPESTGGRNRRRCPPAP
jgi:hypothetical protein